ncbi:gas vesicle protein GvpG [Streptomyces sp. NRRL F-5123]|uniref:gas vesicle protein GvpG n=1 Tax=Streptomyces sp. NRRL F-5123 TaxID=1463856 RepID=UPI000693708E|nr:gas vesicle protein GvpG [Streptomyces sp. NRRL F-5123]
MGIFKALLFLPLAPVQGVSWITTVLQDAAVAEMYDPAVLRDRLVALHRAYDDGEIDDEEFEAAEERLLDLLDRPAPVRLKAVHLSKGTC